MDQGHQINQELLDSCIQQPQTAQKITDYEQKYYSNNNILSSLIFSWISPLLQYGNKIDLQQKAVPQLRPQHKSSIEFDKLQKTFIAAQKSKIPGITLSKSILKAFRKQFILILVFSIIKTALQMYSPIISHNIINYISSGQKNTEQSVIYFLAVLLITLLLALDTSYLFFYFGVLGFNLSNTLSLLVFNKALKHPLITEKRFTIADIINYSQVDAQRMTYMGFQMVALFFTPVQIAIGLYLLYVYIGPSFLVGTGVMFLLMIFTLFFSKVASKYNDKLLKAKDQRMKTAQQIVQIIKFIKINALEKHFFQKLNKKREKQLRLIKKVNVCYVINTFVYWLCPPLIVSATFLLYVYQGNQITAAKAFITIIIFNILQYPMRLFPTSISAFLQIWSSIKRIQQFLFSQQIQQKQLKSQPVPNTSNFAVQIQHGYYMWGKQKQENEGQKMQRKDSIREYRSSKNKQSNSPREKGKKRQISSADDNEIMNDQQNISESANSQASSIYIQKQPVFGSKAKNQEKLKSRYIKALHDLNIKIPSKKITMVIGDIGSGKTSLLYAILNQMTEEPMRNPTVNIYGTIAYAPQKPWIMSGTVKQNIVFFKQYDENKLKKVLHYSCLKDDLNLFTNGIDSQIGQKGVNLSGGQKARISLARALYSDAEIYLFDDILSAVDVHVGTFIMQQTIMKYLKNKTIIMPTHAIKYIQNADNIIFMKKGRAVIQGSLKYAKKFQQFKQMMKHLQLKQNQQNNEKQQMAIKNEQKIVKQTSRSIAKSFRKSIVQQNLPQTAQAVSIQAVDKVIQQLIMPEDHKVGKVSKQIYWKYLKNNGGFIFVFSVLFCLSLWTVLSTISNIQIKRWCQDQTKSWFHLYLFLGLAISATIFSGVQSYILVISGIRQGRTVHKQVVKALLYSSLTKFYNRVPIGRILNRLSKDLRQLDQAIGFTMGGFLVNVFNLFASLIMCIYGSTIWMIIPIIISGYLCFKIKNYYLKCQRQCVRLQNISNSPIVSGFASVINGVATIRAYGLQKQFLKHQQSKIDINKRMKISRSAMQSWFALRLTFLSFLINMTAIGFCILGSNQNASIAGLLLTYSTVLGDDIINVAFSYASLELKMISVQRVLTFTEIEPEPGYKQYCQKWRTMQQGSDLNAISEGRIQFKNYSSKYREQLPFVIKNVNISINSGDKVGIVGRTGAGKSTLISCIFRILDPVQGSIYIDGKDIMDFKLKDLRSCITMIQQQPTLMNGTFRNNLDPINMYSDQELIKVLQQCNLLDMVEAKGGLDQKVSNQTLSVGEKQLLCICRAFLRKSKIILVDQATANIDIKNDHLIQQVISENFKNSTVLTIAHRLSTLKDCNKILVLGAGKVLQWGSAIQLLGSDSIYRKMCESNDKSYLQ